MPTLSIIEGEADRKYRLALRVIAATVLAACILGANGKVYADQWRWNNVERVVAIADIHGAYDEFVHLLKATELIDEELRWTGARTHLVIVGDVLDRGAGSRGALELIIRLEQEAAGTDGRVHLVLGNHEIMNLVGDLAYMTRAE